MELRFEHRAYRRTFRRPLVTAHGEWAVREGFILRYEQSGVVGYAEVAPLPEFGTETVEAAGAMLARLTAEPGLAIPESHPCCAFARSMMALGDKAVAGGGGLADRPVAALLPAGERALLAAAQMLASGYTTLKWKIGVQEVETELAILRDLLAQMPGGVRLRIDANGGLTQGDLARWLGVLAEQPGKIEFLEQPLPPGREALMAEMSVAAGVPIALDESLNGPLGARWLRPGAWAGPLVIKPLLMGPAPQLVASLKPVADQLVLSSVFETAVGVQNVLSLAAHWSESLYALGFDTREAFDDSWSVAGGGPRLLSAPITQAGLEQIWNELPHLT